jgi:glycosyltransferase involved in cell wall biosynthesis
MQVPELTILMPCLNEAETLATCIAKANRWIAASGVAAEVVIADNGSTDGSQDIALGLGARVVAVPERGYGAALYHGAVAARGKWIIMGDSDDSYDFSRLDAFVARLREGYDLVMGNRFAGGIEPGAMPWKNRYIGNPILSAIGRLLFKCPARDFHCGLRGFSKQAFAAMDLRTSGMEFASEMVIKATLFGMRICEVPTTLSPDGRSRPPHLRPWRDGWRHLRFMLLFSPRWLFAIPGLVLAGLSAVVYLRLLFGPLDLGSVVLDVHTLLFAQAGIALGALTLATGVAVRRFGEKEGLLKPQAMLAGLRRRGALEAGSAIGLAMIAGGLVLGLTAFSKWAAVGFGALQYTALFREVSVATLLFNLGGIVLMTSLVNGFLTLPVRRSAA